MNRNVSKSIVLPSLPLLRAVPIGGVAKICLLVIGSFTAFPADRAWGQGSRQDYGRSDSYDRRTRDLVYRDSVRPNWLADDLDRFWYRVDVGKNSHRFVLVDAKAGERTAAFDHLQLARQLGEQTASSLHPDKLDLQSLTFDLSSNSCQFGFDQKRWTFELPRGPLRQADADPDAETKANERLEPLTRIRRSTDGRGERTTIRFDNRRSEPLEYLWVMSDGGLRSYGKVAAGSSQELSTFDGHAWVLKTDAGETVAAFVASSRSDLAVIDEDTPKPEPQWRRENQRRVDHGASSPDHKWRITFEDHNVVLTDNDSGDTTTITADGTKDDSYGGRVWWSPNSEHFVVMKAKPGNRRTIHMIDSAPDDSIHSKLITVPYAKPGDRVDHPRPVLFHVDGRQGRPIDDALFGNPFELTDLAWRGDSSSFSFLYNQRGHQQLRLISVDVETATARVVIDESSATFVCYSGKKFLHRLDDTAEVIWMSERSGWNHLYLIDFETGLVHNAITSGNWVVREVERVDAQRRQIWLNVSGMDPDQDPYHQHLIRVDFDGSNLTRLTEADGDHQWSFSPDGRYIIDEYSRVDLPPVSELRGADSGQRICRLEAADASALQATGWNWPERFVAPGRDGKTDIHGIIIRPTNFDPHKRYPVLEQIYAGPHSAFVPKRFSRHSGLYSMAELGFIVVKIDGMGTSHRSKAFHDVCWKNLADSGFADRIAWIKAAAQDRPEMDLQRVGIWGGSAGGQSAMRALIAHGDFYRAAVADCGCHDNRVDKLWWNEQWMGWPIGAHYEQQSNVTGAHRLQGDLMLIWGELDHNVDPASSMQVVDALVQAGKDFEMLVMPGVGHGAAGHPYARRRQADFFVRKLWHQKPRHDSAELVPVDLPGENGGQTQSSKDE